MFRNPRENQALPPSSRVTPSTGRPPSPSGNMAAKAPSKRATPKSKPTPTLPKKQQSTLVPSEFPKKSQISNGIKPKAKPAATPNGNIMAFFKKAEEQNNSIFLRERGVNPTIVLDEESDAGEGRDDELGHGVMASDNFGERYNENSNGVKKRKIQGDSACSPPPPDDDKVSQAPLENAAKEPLKVPQKRGPFVDDSDSDTDEASRFNSRRGTIIQQQPPDKPPLSERQEPPADSNDLPVDRTSALQNSESASQFGGDDFDEFEGLEDDDMMEGEEYDERRWMQEQERLEMEENHLEMPMMFSEEPVGDRVVDNTGLQHGDAPSCPLCNASLEGVAERDVSIHVNGCLDGNPVPLTADTPTPRNNAKMFKQPPRPARPGQANPFELQNSTTKSHSAFSKLMAGHAEDAAWATAAASDKAARGKPAYQRTCPFYKIMPGFYICVDAFRYGAVKGQNAYFLSHFHSDHYVGLTQSWSHGPIYCSKVTANLVRQQLHVDPKLVVGLEFEVKTEVPGTEGVHVTMIPANHCPGSSLFLFEKNTTDGRLQRVLHCGDFRACQAHIEHPLLKPYVTGKSAQQKLDACYLDTTYLNPKYAFPPQQQVIQACADMCVSLSKVRPDDSDGWEKMKRNRAGMGMVKFVQKESDANLQNKQEPTSPAAAERGRLLVVVGTYSIGKERICLGIAKALNSKIYAPPNKQRICHALQDPELESLLTTDPRAAQVHMTPLFEIRADTLDDYLGDYKDTFSRCVGFRPSGWNYRPPNSRFTESPTVQTVLHSKGWKSDFTMKELKPQRGSTSRASCFGVPYSEHSSFRELTMFCCALRIDKIIPTVNVGSAKSREKMKGWCDKWALDKKKNGLFKLDEGGEW